ncbi:hypothetical protein [Serratia marcescens]|uniref:hypothetical protein n=1 Tax=Serratia marcescens TaxID=615 RepID=UPI003F7FCE4A
MNFENDKNKEHYIENECNTKKETIITVNVDGVKKTILKIKLKKNGDVMLFIKHAAFFRDAGGVPSFSKKISQQRYSIHRSIESKEKINFIKQTLEVNGDGIINTHLVTPVIKNNSGFIQIFSRRIPNLSPEHYSVDNNNGKFIEESLGAFKSNKMTLMFSIFVGASALTVPDSFNNVNVRSFIRGEFRFLIIWTYILVASHSSGTLMHFGSIKGSDGEAIGQQHGVDASGATIIAVKGFCHLVAEYAQTLHLSEGIPVEYILEIFKNTGFVKGEEI